MDLKDHLLATHPVVGGDSLGKVAQGLIQPGCELCQGWGIHNLRGQPLPVKKKKKKS